MTLQDFKVRFCGYLKYFNPISTRLFHVKNYCANKNLSLPNWNRVNPKYISSSLWLYSFAAWAMAMIFCTTPPSFCLSRVGMRQKRKNTHSAVVFVTIDWYDFWNRAATFIHTPLGWGTKVCVQNWLEPSSGILHRYHLTRGSTLTLIEKKWLLIHFKTIFTTSE